MLRKWPQLPRAVRSPTKVRKDYVDFEYRPTLTLGDLVRRMTIIVIVGLLIGVIMAQAGTNGAVFQ